MAGTSLERFPLHLGLEATAVPQPEFTGAMQWYMDYGQRHGDDGAEGRLVSMHSFTESWESWEMHPAGSEVVVCISGAVTFLQEFPGGRTEKVSLEPGEYAVNPPGVWHTADTDGSTVLFITAGMGTEVRPR